jgi:TP901 family phage tail tape measure protein
MAKYALTLEMNLQSPRNLSKVVNQLKSEFGNVNIDVRAQTDPRALNRVNQEIQNITKNSKIARKEYSALADIIGTGARRFAAISFATGTFVGLARSIKSSLKEAIQFEKKMLVLSQVTGKSVAQLQDLNTEVVNLSKSLGLSSDGLLDTAIILSQAGFSAKQTKDSLEVLAKTQLAASFDDIEETTEGAIAVLSQFRKDAIRAGGDVKFLEQALGAINEVSKAFAVESSDLISTIRKAGGSFEAAGGSLNELLSLFTSVRATTRESAESIATGLRTIFTRIQRVETISQLQKLGIELQDLEGKFIGPFEAIKRISQGLSEIDPRDIRFAAITEELGGFRQIGKVIPLIKQFTLAEQALAVAQGSTNSLTEDQVIAQQSLENQIKRVREEFQDLIRTFQKSDTFQLFVRTSLSIASAMIKVAESMEPILPLLTAFASVQLGKGLVSIFSGGFGGGRGVIGRNSGGSIPGSGSSDTVPAMLTPGEFVIKKSSVRQIGLSNLQKINANPQYFAEGGPVKTSQLYPRDGIQGIKTLRQIIDSKKNWGKQRGGHDDNLLLNYDTVEVDPLRSSDKKSLKNYVNAKISEEKSGEASNLAKGLAFEKIVSKRTGKKVNTNNDFLDLPFGEIKSDRNFGKSMSTTSDSYLTILTKSLNSKRGYLNSLSPNIDDIYPTTKKISVYIDKYRRYDRDKFKELIDSKYTQYFADGGVVLNVKRDKFAGLFMNPVGGKPKEYMDTQPKGKSVQVSKSIKDDLLQKGLNSIQGGQSLTEKYSSISPISLAKSISLGYTIKSPNNDDVDIDEYFTTSAQNIIASKYNNNPPLSVTTAELSAFNKEVSEQTAQRLVDEKKLAEGPSITTRFNTSKGNKPMTLSGPTTLFTILSSNYKQELDKIKDTSIIKSSPAGTVKDLNIAAANDVPAFYPSTENIRQDYKTSINSIISEQLQMMLSNTMMDLADAILSKNKLNINPSAFMNTAGFMVKDTGLKGTIGGYLFEGLVSSLTNIPLPGQGDDFDFTSDLKNLSLIFSQMDDMNLVAADAKYQRERKSVDSIIRSKIPRFISQNTTGDLSQYIDDVKFFATGGLAKGTDTVPAMLTPGEFIVKKSSAEKIGYSRLSQMNNNPVSYFAEGSSYAYKELSNKENERVRKRIMDAQNKINEISIMQEMDQSRSEIKKLEKEKTSLQKEVDKLSNRLNRPTFSPSALSDYADLHGLGPIPDAMFDTGGGNSQNIVKKPISKISANIIKSQNTPTTPRVKGPVNDLAEQMVRYPEPIINSPPGVMPNTRFQESNPSLNKAYQNKLKYKAYIHTMGEKSNLPPLYSGQPNPSGYIEGLENPPIKMSRRFNRLAVNPQVVQENRASMTELYRQIAYKSGIADRGKVTPPETESQMKKTSEAIFSSLGIQGTAGVKGTELSQAMDLFIEEINKGTDAEEARIKAYDKIVTDRSKNLKAFASGLPDINKTGVSAFIAEKRGQLQSFGSNPAAIKDFTSKLSSSALTFSILSSSIGQVASQFGVLDQTMADAIGQSAMTFSAIFGIGTAFGDVLPESFAKLKGTVVGLTMGMALGASATELYASKFRSNAEKLQGEFNKLVKGIESGNKVKIGDMQRTLLDSMAESQRAVGIKSTGLIVTTIGTVAGAAIGTFIGGPFGTMVGGAIGGALGGALGSFAGSFDELSKVQIEAVNSYVDATYTAVKSISDFDSALNIAKLKNLDAVDSLSILSSETNKLVTSQKKAQSSARLNAAQMNVISQEPGWMQTLTGGKFGSSRGLTDIEKKNQEALQGALTEQNTKLTGARTQLESGIFEASESFGKSGKSIDQIFTQLSPALVNYKSTLEASLPEDKVGETYDAFVQGLRKSLDANEKQRQSTLELNALQKAQRESALETVRAFRTLSSIEFDNQKFSNSLDNLLSAVNGSSASFKQLQLPSVKDLNVDSLRTIDEMTKNLGSYGKNASANIAESIRIFQAAQDKLLNTEIVSGPGSIQTSQQLLEALGIGAGSNAGKQVSLAFNKIAKEQGANTIITQELINQLLESVITDSQSYIDVINKSASLMENQLAQLSKTIEQTNAQFAKVSELQKNSLNISNRLQDNISKILGDNFPGRNDMARRQANRNAAAQIPLNRFGINANNISDLSNAAKNAQRELNILARSNITGSDQVVKFNKLSEQLKLTTDRLRELSDQSELTNDVMSKFEKIQNGINQKNSKIEEFILGGAESRNAMSMDFAALQTSIMTGSFQTLNDEMRGRVSSLLESLSDVELTGGMTGKDIRRSLLAQDFLRMVPGATIKQAAQFVGAATTSEQDKLIASLTAISQQEQAANNALINIEMTAANTLMNAANLIKNTFANFQNRIGNSPLKFNMGGKVPGVGNSDNVEALLTPGEFVMRKDAVKKYGTGMMQKMNSGGIVKNYTGQDIKALSNKQIPETILDDLINSGLSVKRGPSLIDIDPELRFQQPRGYADNFSFNNVKGLYRDANKEILLKNDSGINVFGHELGHAFDYYKDSISQSKEYMIAYMKDISKLGKQDQERFKYLLQSGPAGKKESFASIFDSVIRNQSSSAKFFPETTRLVENITKNHEIDSLQNDYKKLMNLRDIEKQNYQNIESHITNTKSKISTSLVQNDPRIVKFLDMLNMAESMYANKFNSGGRVPGAGNSDTVPALLTPGEFVMNKRAVKEIGQYNLIAMNNGNIQKKAQGGTVQSVRDIKPKLKIFGSSSEEERTKELDKLIQDKQKLILADEQEKKKLEKQKNEKLIVDLDRQQRIRDKYSNPETQRKIEEAERINKQIEQERANIARPANLKPQSFADLGAGADIFETTMPVGPPVQRQKPSFIENRRGERQSRRDAARSQRDIAQQLNRGGLNVGRNIIAQQGPVFGGAPIVGRGQMPIVGRAQPQNQNQVVAPVAAPQRPMQAQGNMQQPFVDVAGLTKIAENINMISGKIEKVVNTLNGMKMEHTVKFDGILNIGGLDIGRMKEEFKQAISNLVVEEVKKHLDRKV